MTAKRTMDMALSVVALVVLGPLILAVAGVIRLTMGSPVLFRQERTGLGGRKFLINKFRTMNSSRGADGNLLPDHARLTPVGRVLRRTSLDELPQLLNVIGGAMSLVGPRPLLPEYVPLYTPTQRRRLEVRPGITGWAQVNGRHALTLSQRFELDVWYVDHWSISLDCRILLRTVPKVLFARGVVLSDDRAGVKDFCRSPAGTALDVPTGREGWVAPQGTRAREVAPETRDWPFPRRCNESGDRCAAQPDCANCSRGPE